MRELEIQYERNIRLQNEAHDDVPEENVAEGQKSDALFSQDSENAQEEDKDASKLWIDKYTSHKFLDLLTDEVLNRNVLTWIKSWDTVVFPERSKVNLRLPDSVTKGFGHQAPAFRRDITFRKVDAQGNVYYASAD